MGDFSKEVGANFDSEYLKAMLNLKYTATFLNTIMIKELEPYQISPAQYNILRILRGAKKAMTMKLVKEKMIEKSPNTTRLADRLCEKNLIERIRSEKDRRVVSVLITQKGLDMLSEIVFKRAPKQVSNLNDSEVLVLNSLLDKIRD